MTAAPRFLVRTKENRITGPFEKEELAARVSRGELRELDEICEAGGYWIYLHERSESKKLLGAELPRAKRKTDQDEDTETETETVTATAPLSISRDGEGTVRVVRQAPAQQPVFTNRTPETLSLMKYLLITIAIVIGYVVFRVFEIAREY